MCKNSWTDRDAVLVVGFDGPKESCVIWASRCPNGKGQYCGKGAPVVKYRNFLPWAAQKRLNRSICHLGCGLGWAEGNTNSIVFARWHHWALTGQHNGPTWRLRLNVRLRRRWGVMSNYFDHLLYLLPYEPPQFVAWRWLYAPAARLACWESSLATLLPPPVSSLQTSPTDVGRNERPPSATHAQWPGVGGSWRPPLPRTDTVSRPILTADTAVDTPEIPRHGTHTVKLSNRLQFVHVHGFSTPPLFDVNKYVASLILFVTTASLLKKTTTTLANLRG